MSSGNANKVPDVIPFYSHLRGKNKSPAMQRGGESMDQKILSYFIIEK